MNHLLVTMVFLTLILIAGCKEVKPEHEMVDRMDSYLAALEQVGFQGAVLVGKQGQQLISKGYGYSDVENQIKNSPATIFDIGSITKQFTAAAILKLEMQGKLSTDDKISRYFDNLPADKDSMTIHDLLRHQSGLESNVGRDFDSISEAVFLDSVFSSALLFTPGTGFSYSNIGYSLLAIIIEKVSKQTYETYLYENLWKPAHMEMTGYTRPPFDTMLIAVGYSSDHKVWGKPTDKAWDVSAPYLHLKGNGGILSTTEDLYKWHNCLMTENVLSKEAKQKLYHPRLRPGENEGSYYAYGWDVSMTDRKTTQVWHNGTNNILYADFLRYPDEDVALIMLTNMSHPNFNGLNFELATIIFNPQYQPSIPAADNEENRSFTNRMIKTVADFGLDTAKAEYTRRKQSEQLLEFVMRNEGFGLLDSHQPDLALQVFELNVFAYPQSYKALQGLGEAYMETGKKDLALKYFRESLGIKPNNPFVNNMIKKLEGE